jgi:hypothetical protein
MSLLKPSILEALFRQRLSLSEFRDRMSRNDIQVITKNAEIRDGHRQLLVTTDQEGRVVGATAPFQKRKT